MSRRWVWLTSIIIPLLAFGIMWLFFQSGSPNHKKNTNAMTAYGINISYQDYDNQGALQSKLTAQKATHFKNDDSTNLTMPNGLIYTTQHIPWHVTANIGKSFQGTKRILLSDNVVLSKPQTLNSPKTTIKTQQVTIFPSRSYATSKMFVSLKQPGTLTTGVGMRADMKHNIVTLLTQTRSDLAPQDKKTNQHKS